MFDRRQILAISAGSFALSGCTSNEENTTSEDGSGDTGDGSGDTGDGSSSSERLNQPRCSSADHFELVDAEYQDEAYDLLTIDRLAFENIGNQPAYDVEVHIDTNGYVNTISTDGVWDAGTRFQVENVYAEADTSEEINNYITPSDITVSISADLGDEYGESVNEMVCRE